MHPPVLHSHAYARFLKHPVFSFGMPVSKMDILRQSLQKQNLNTIQTTPSTIPLDSLECPKVQGHSRKDCQKVQQHNK